jgi:hypothetical protein
LLRRLFYREYGFAVLEGEELARVFAAFACVVRLHPVVLYWVRRVGADESLVFRFQHPSMVRYTGLEVVHVTSDQCGYYRLPGARPGGRGRVACGTYAVSIQAPNRARHHLRIAKCEPGELRLDEVCAPLPRDRESFRPLVWHALHPSKFADEMRTIVERGVEWEYQRALLGEPRRISDAEWTEMARACAGISRRTDILLGELGWPVHRGGAEP